MSIKHLSPPRTTIHYYDTTGRRLQGRHSRVTAGAEEAIAAGMSTSWTSTDRQTLADCSLPSASNSGISGDAFLNEGEERSIARYLVGFAIIA